MVVTGAEHEAAGVKAVMVSLQRGLESMGAVRIRRRAGRAEYWLSQQGRLTHPVVLRRGDDHYRPTAGMRRTG